MPSTTHLPAAADSQNSTLMTPSVRAIQALVGGNTATARTVSACGGRGTDPALEPKLPNQCS